MSSDRSRRGRRVVIFDAYPHAYGGAQHIDHLLARELPGHGWSVSTVVPARGRFVDRLERDGLDVEVVAPPRSLTHFGGSTVGWQRAGALLALPWYWLRLTRRLRRLRPAVAHIVDLRGMILAGVPARLAGARVVWHVQLTVGGPSINRLAAMCAHAIVVPSRAAADQTAAGWPRRRIEVIPNVAAGAARRTSPVELVLDPVVVTLARVHPQKGLDVLVRAAALLAPRHPGIEVLIAGDDDPGYPDERARLEALFHATARAGRVAFLGFRPDPDEVVARGRVYVQPSRHEALPLAILEAMAVGVPVVACDVGGVAEVLVDGVNGLLVPPENPVALAAALDRLLTDAPLCERLRRAAFETVNAVEYSPAGTVASTVALYERIV